MKASILGLDAKAVDATKWTETGLEITNDFFHALYSWDYIFLLTDASYKSTPSFLMISAKPPLSYRTPAWIAALQIADSSI